MQPFFLLRSHKLAKSSLCSKYILKIPFKPLIAFTESQHGNETNPAISRVQPECFKTRAVHFPIWRDERTSMQRATLSKSGSKTASQLQGQTARAFSSNSLVKTMEMTAVIQYIFTATQFFGAQDYCKKSRMTILGLPGVLFCANEQA